MNSHCLYNLLKEYPKLYATRILELQRMQDSGNIIVFGAGTTSLQILEQLLELGCKPIAFCDNNPAKIGTQVRGLPVLSFDELCRLFRNGKEYIYISVQLYWREIFSQLRQAGFAENRIALHDHIIQLPWEVNAEATINEQMSELIHLYDYLADNISRDVLYRRCAFLLSRQRKFMAEIHRPCQYFEPQIIQTSKHEVFADIGTFTGDTILSYINFSKGEYKHIYGFEPNQQLFHQATTNLSEYLNITLVPMGTANYSGKVSIASSLGLMQSIEAKIFKNNDASERYFSVCRLDEYFANVPHTPTFIKMDIEGAEYDTLSGAERIISQDSPPQCAICVYHCEQDIINIPKFLYNCNSSYKFYLRHYSDNSTETVLYAVH